jgi:hypothetical protein
MDRATVGERAFATAMPQSQTEAIDFVRFCHRRRRVGWPELYDEMCAVAGRGLYRGYGTEELAAIGIGFGLFQMPALAGLVAQVVAEDVERRRRSAEAVRAALSVDVGSADGEAGSESPGAAGLVEELPVGPSRRPVEPEPVETGLPDLGAIRIAVAAGA